MHTSAKKNVLQKHFAVMADIGWALWARDSAAPCCVRSRPRLRSRDPRGTSSPSGEETRLPQLRASSLVLLPTFHWQVSWPSPGPQGRGVHSGQARWGVWGQMLQPASTDSPVEGCVEGQRSRKCSGHLERTGRPKEGASSYLIPSYQRTPGPRALSSLELDGTLAPWVYTPHQTWRSDKPGAPWVRRSDWDVTRLRGLAVLEGFAWVLNQVPV